MGNRRSWNGWPRGWDIVRQARGEEEEEYVEPDIDLQLPERAQLAQILYHQPQDLSAAALLERRIQVAELMVALCDKRETSRCRLIRRGAPYAGPFPAPHAKAAVSSVHWGQNAAIRDESVPILSTFCDE
jgi:hypothetical protein